jgi:hypothetical protein
MILVRAHQVALCRDLAKKLPAGATWREIVSAMEAFLRRGTPLGWYHLHSALAKAPS